MFLLFDILQSLFNHLDENDTLGGRMFVTRAASAVWTENKLVKREPKERRYDDDDDDDDAIVIFSFVE